ncbi:hypothetical protein AB8O53_00205, partial [Streptomyces pilosus]
AGASVARLSRAAWIRRAAAGALPETLEGLFASSDMFRFLSTAGRGTDPAQDVDDASMRRLLSAADHGTSASSRSPPRR